MAGRRVHGASNMAVFLHNQGISAVGIESLLASGSSPNQIHGVRSIVNAEDTYEHLLGRSYYRPLCLKRISEENLDERFHHPEKKRRLTVDQIEFLDKSFELDNKLEPDRKIQLARDLGIQPRQVAIWFQNRRARCKTKQLEMDFEVLKSSYDVLKEKHDNLLKEKEKLNDKVLYLTEKLNLKGKDRLNSGSFPLSKPTGQVQNQDPKSFSEAKKTDTTVVECNHEELSSADGAAFDSNNCNDVAGLYVNAFEPVHCDLTHLEENEVGECNYLKLEDNSYEFLEEDQGLWFWP